VAVRFLLDENVEHEGRHRLEGLGYEVRHVQLEPRLGQGARDSDIATVSREIEWVIVTYDPDFVTQYAESDFYGAVYFEDAVSRRLRLPPS
jgi:predicted nuclease of predicted toxin-antitoxin system